MKRRTFLQVVSGGLALLIGPRPSVPPVIPALPPPVIPAAASAVVMEKVTSAAWIAPGDLLMLNDWTGAVATVREATARDHVIGVALEADKDGMVEVLIGPGVTRRMPIRDGETVGNQAMSERLLAALSTLLESGERHRYDCAAYSESQECCLEKPHVLADVLAELERAGLITIQRSEP